MQAGEALERFITVIEAAAPNPSPSDFQAMYDAWLSFLHLTEEVGELKMPKRHMGNHLVDNVRRHGNPKRYANWLDEGLNRELKQACRNVSQVTFEPFLLLRMKELLYRRGHKRKHQ